VALPWHHGFVADHDPGPRGAEQAGEWAAEAGRDSIALPGGGRVLVGTASWTDPTMTAPGVFYPRGTDTAEERLAYYASQFPLVEVDATYYALPSPGLAELWRERTPPDFTFDIKAHALMTGQPTETKRLPKAIREALPVELASKPRLYGRDLPAELMDTVWTGFVEALSPLREAGQLGSILLQYPKWFFPSRESREAILEARDKLGGLQVAVEFRHGSWFNDKNVERTLAFLSDSGLPFVMVDEPQGSKSSVPDVFAVTSDKLALVRFHGRNVATWDAKGVTPAERFRYLYDRDELSEWVPRVTEAAGQAAEVHLLMNNCYANYGAVNARQIAKLLEEDLAGTG
jgi:uncharacterized protein YecE (DUF72 family)